MGQEVLNNLNGQAVTQQGQEFFPVPGGVGKSEVGKKGKHQKGGEMFPFVVKVRYHRVIQRRGGQMSDDHQGDRQGETKELCQRQSGRWQQSLFVVRLLHEPRRDNRCRCGSRACPSGCVWPIRRLSAGPARPYPQVQWRRAPVRLR